MYSQRELKQFDKWGKKRPEHEEHGDIHENIQKLKPKKWRLEGNKLIAETEMGPLVNYIPTDYIMTGVDDEGLPVLEKIDKRKH